MAQLNVDIKYTRITVALPERTGQPDYVYEPDWQPADGVKVFQRHPLVLK
jgi:hypothetical protein